MQQSGQRAHGERAVGMPGTAYICGLGALAADDPVGDFEDFRIVLVAEMPFRMLLQLAEVPAERDVLRQVDMLARKHQMR